MTAPRKRVLDIKSSTADYILSCVCHLPLRSFRFFASVIVGDFFKWIYHPNLLYNITESLSPPSQHHINYAGI